jgi:hypothetical protein
MKKSKSFFSRLKNGGLYFRHPVDEGGWFSQVLAARKTAAEYTKLTKTSVFSACSAVKQKFAQSASKFLCALVS